MNLSDLYEVAARASINERCAPAYLHDIRGSMQALFSALELLGRSARTNGGDPARVEKACALAKRAIYQHEKSTLQVLEALTLHEAEAGTVEVGALVCEVTHFLRNEAANKQVTLRISDGPPLLIAAERVKLRTLLIGLLAAALDELPPGAELHVSSERSAGFAVVCLGSGTAFDMTEGRDLLSCPAARLSPHELTLQFARQLLANNGGRLEIAQSPPKGTLRLYYPLSADRIANDHSTRSLAATLASDIEK